MTPIIAILASCSQVRPAPPARARTTTVAHGTFAVPDEVMEFRIELRGIHVATVQTALGQPGWVDGRRAIIAKSRGQTDGLLSVIGDVTWELETTIDLDTGMPIENHEEARGELAGEQAHDEHRHAWSVGEDRHDVHSAIGVLRAWQSAAGARIALTVELGGGRFDVVLVDGGRDRVAGRRAVRLDGTADKLPFALWLSDDAARVPLAFETTSPLGVIDIDLVDYSTMERR